MRAVLTILLILGFLAIQAQEEKLEIEGAIQIGNSEDPEPDPGTIRWTGSDFEGWDGSDWISLTGGFVKDVDNNSYKIVKIGTQTWMAENLKVTRYNDETLIPLVTDNTDWNNLTTPGHTWYNNGGEEPRHGALYNYYVVADSNTLNVCPTGWHVPSDLDWTTLTDYLGGSDVAGGKMKEAGLAHWISPNSEATNESGFSGLPSGYLGGDYDGIGMFTYWWSSTEYIPDNAWIRYQDYLVGEIFRFQANKYHGMSVRCLKDN
ncbi:MAG: fibrobacter succinogenes major paralogous domain-containing protein [Saprospiraceae bacterium]|nr:fibrobacter succinogenes major paralogous domain-containing protein [Saprospiraceae bacterium]